MEARATTRETEAQARGAAGRCAAGADGICDNVRMPQQPEPQIVTGSCPNCGSDRKAHVRCKYVVNWTDEDDGTFGSDTGMILECCGCEQVYFRRDRRFSEWETLGEHPITGELRLEGGVETVYWPTPASRQRPNWLQRTQKPECGLGQLLEELYVALDNDLRVLAAVAVRTVVDCASELLGVDPAKRFGEKLQNLQAAGKISRDEEEVLQVLVEGGSAAAHRGWRPKAEELDTMVEVVESFLHRSFVLDDGVKKLRASVPPRPKRA